MAVTDQDRLALQVSGESESGGPKRFATDDDGVLKIKDIYRGLVYLGAVTTATDTTHFKASGLAGFGNGYYKNWECYPVWDAGGAGAAPQNEHKPVSAYTSSDGTFTHTAFTAQLAVTDKVLLIHPWLVANADWLDGGRLDLILDNILTAVTGGVMDFRTEQSKGGPVEENQFQMFSISLFDIDSGAIVVGNIDITAITATLEKSTGGADFSAVGITQPTFAKAAGRVYCSYQFLTAEWAVGDLYRLTVSGITCTVDSETLYVPTMVWSNAVLEAATIDANVEDIQSNVGAMADAATADDLSDVTTTSMQAKLRRILTRQSGDAYTATINGAAQTAEDAALAALATYFKAAGAAFSATVGGSARTDVESAITALAAYFNAASAALSVVSQPGVAARTDLNAIVTDLADILAGTSGITNFPAGVAAGDGVSIAEVVRYIQETCVGLEGATTLANKLTAARAALIDQITALRMAELDAANLPADVDTLKTRVGDPSGDTLTSTTAKLGNLARALATILGTRWNAAGDLGTDVAQILTDLSTIAGYLDTEIATIISELAKVPKSDSNVTWNATALASVNAEVDTALNTIVPASPTAGSLNDILSVAAGANTFDKSTDSLEAIRNRVDTLATFERLLYEPGLQNSGDLEAATTSITATSEAVGTGNADYSSALTLADPDDVEIVIKRICARVSITPDSFNAGCTHLYCRVYVDAQDADHKLFDLDISAASNYLAAVDTHSGAYATIFNLLKDGQAHTFYFFFWVDAGNAVLSVVNLWEGVGSCSTSAVAVLSFDLDGLVSISMSKSRTGSGTSSTYILTEAPNDYYVFQFTGAVTTDWIQRLDQVAETCEVSLYGTVATDLNYLNKIRLVRRSA